MNKMGKIEIWLHFFITQLFGCYTSLRVHIVGHFIQGPWLKW
jgi:hypothetical protein